jgi:hypothetical protein
MWSLRRAGHGQTISRRPWQGTCPPCSNTYLYTTQQLSVTVRTATGARWLLFVCHNYRGRRPGRRRGRERAGACSCCLAGDSRIGAARARGGKGKPAGSLTPVLGPLDPIRIRRRAPLAAAGRCNRRRRQTTGTEPSGGETGLRPLLARRLSRSSCVGFYVRTTLLIPGDESLSP